MAPSEHVSQLGKYPLYGDNPFVMEKASQNRFVESMTLDQIVLAFFIGS